MNDDQITSVQESFAKVVPIKDAAAEIFYNRLFEVAPQVRPMFKGDVSEQGTKLMATLGVVVNGLRDLEKIVPVAEALAVKHIEYGVTAEHYDIVGATLLFTLKAGLGDDFTGEVEEAWTAAYTTLSGVMVNAAYKPAAE
ncbi:globin domain-containing protein [Octadecabacter sp. CECT 8868]|uniref:globin family protein n=1 Tax=Octadecabacter algicola TaxID=2909342 RepID=UPI001F269BB3|nr:globin family protein [Octadecabacter algicola]MCF2905355.1 globin domain-containing protein [Octadecabacter algicola]